ncbi:MAG TPA: AI-2E family transporter [Longimicrobiales bacterium]|nr:AI-2E family transporter [Longimicrobiales bacterium]
MIFDGSEKTPGARFLLILACLVVVVYGLKFAAPILLPAALALFLAVLSLPVMLFLRHRKVPSSLAIALTMLVSVGVFGLLALLASGSVEEFQTRLPAYAARLSTLQDQWIQGLGVRLGLPVEDYIGLSLINPAAIVDIAGGALSRIAQFVSTTLLVFLITIFMLAEAIVFPDKVRFLLGGQLGHEDRLAKVVGEIQTYLGIKTVVSLATGIILGLWCYVMELDFPVLLGLVAFVLNYVPTVGSIIAAAPAILLSLILHGTLAHALGVTAGYVVVNALFGNILEPNLMGRRLGLSTLVVILSLLFWGWTWGPLGALLSVPLTVIVKIWLENTPDLRWVALLLDKTPPARSETLAGPDPEI